VNTITITSEDYDAFREFLEDVSGIVLGENKHYLVTSRLARLMNEFGVDSFSELMSRMKQDNKLRHRIMDAMTTNETSWFRDSYPFDILKEKIYPEFAKQKLTQIRIWSAACSTGQEPYSISMATSEYLQSRPGSFRADAVQIVGTDISSSVLAHARDGVYEGVAAARGLSPERKKRFFRQVGDNWQVVDEVRSRISFREMNLMQSYASLGKFDVIYCRNVLIYFSTDLKCDIMQRMTQLLKPHGYLILGGSESISGYSNDYVVVRWNGGVIYSPMKSTKP
jgi:chemotaxis protein methyltransferase CheR